MSARLPSLDSAAAPVADKLATTLLSQHARALVEKAVRHSSAMQLEGEENPETLLKLRVALRRLRCVLWAFSPLLPSQHGAYWRETLAHATRRAGLARDWDMLIDEVLPQAGLPERLFTAEFKAALEARRLNARAQSRRDLAQSDLSNLLHECLWSLEQAERELLGAMDGSSLHHFAAKRLQKTLDLVQSRAKKARHGTFDDLHKARIAIKRLRYLSEFFEPVLKPQDMQHLNALIELQTQLGRLNDFVVAKELVADWRKDPVLKPAAGKLADWLDRVIEEQLQQSLKILKHYPIKAVH